MLNIDKIFYINLDKRVDRRTRMEKEFLPQLPAIYQDKIERVSAIDNSEAENRTLRAAACAQSHLLIWKKCIEENLNTVLIFEDDLEWKHPEKIEFYFNLLENVDFNLVNLGYVKKSLSEKSEVDDNLVITPVIHEACAYLVKVDFLSKMYPITKEITDFLSKGGDVENHAIDVVWNMFNTADAKWYQTDYRLARQYVDYSNIDNVVRRDISPIRAYAAVKYYKQKGEPLNEIE